jgi:phosphatidylinositol-3-phosphatase
MSKSPHRLTQALYGMLTASLIVLLTSCTADDPQSHRGTQPKTPVSRGTTDSTPTTTGSAPTTSVNPSTGAAATKVLTFVEENSSRAQMQAEMPYLNSLARQYTYASNFTAITHPSLPNYLAMAGGSTFGVTDDADPSENAAHVGDAPSVFDQALANGHTAKTYAESMPGNCALTSSSPYAVKHNPWTYFSAGRANCEKFDVPSGTPDSGALATDIAAGTLPDLGLVIPNMCNDAHDCSLGTADDWLRDWLPAILATPDFTSGRLVVVITADEDDRESGNAVLTVVLHAPGTGTVVTAPLTHYSLSRLYSQMIGAPALDNAQGGPDMSALFGL